jgi:hypothetical protein
MVIPSGPDSSSPRENRASAQHKILEAKQTLTLWKKAYFDIRAKIEASGREARWEFDRKRLFERTDYMASICQDLYDILQVGTMSSLRHSGEIRVGLSLPGPVMAARSWGLKGLGKGETLEGRTSSIFWNVPECPTAQQTLSLSSVMSLAPSAAPSVSFVSSVPEPIHHGLHVVVDATRSPMLTLSLSVKRWGSPEAFCPQAMSSVWIWSQPLLGG